MNEILINMKRLNKNQLLSAISYLLQVACDREDQPSELTDQFKTTLARKAYDCARNH